MAAASLAGFGALSSVGAGGAFGVGHGFLGQFSNVVHGPSTNPGNGDQNPYGVAVVSQTTGTLVAGGVLVSNFNDAGNAQGTGTTIVQQLPDGSMVQFARIDPANAGCPGGVGLTTALTVLPGGWVVVGSLPTSANGAANVGTPQGIGAGCLLVLDSSGNLAATWSGSPINGPWDMAAVTFGDDAHLFVTNVLNGTVAAAGGVVDQGTVVRIDVELNGTSVPQVKSEKIIASGFAEKTDPAALVVGPTGAALGLNGTLYVADTVNSRIAAVPNALFRDSIFGVPGGITVSSSSALSGPLGMALAPNGNIVTVNAGNGLAVETSPFGATVATATLDDTGTPPGAGNLFGVAVVPGGRGLWFVDDSPTLNSLNLFF